MKKDMYIGIMGDLPEGMTDAEFNRAIPEDGFYKIEGQEPFVRSGSAMRKLRKQEKNAATPMEAEKFRAMQIMGSSDKEGKALANTPELEAFQQRWSELKAKAVDKQIPDYPNRKSETKPALRYTLWKAVQDGQDQLLWPSSREQVATVQRWPKEQAAMEDKDGIVKGYTEGIRKQMDADLEAMGLDARVEDIRVEIRPGEFVTMQGINLKDASQSDKDRMKKAQSFFALGAASVFGADTLMGGNETQPQQQGIQ
jgi:hypothetical protein